MQSLKGEPRHYAVAAVHGPLRPTTPSIPPLPPFASLFLLPLSLSLAPSLSLSLLLFSAPVERRADLAFLIS